MRIYCEINELVLVFLLLGNLMPLFAEERPKLAPLRQDEDWYVMESESLRKKPLDFLKYIPLGEDSTYFLTLGGESRLLFQVFRNEAFGLAQEDPSGAFHLRMLLHGNLNLGENFRTYWEFLSAMETGRKAGPGVFDRDDFDVYQGFVEYSLRKRRNNDWNLSLRLGRQALAYGAGSQVSVREGPTAPRSFDAALIRFESRKVRTDLFIGREVSISKGVLDDHLNENQAVWGYNWSTKGKGLFNFDAFYVGSRQSPLIYYKTPGEETRHTLGFRPRFKYGNFTSDLEIIYQVGEFREKIQKRDLTILARAFSLSSAYQFKKTFLKPKLVLEAGYTSGDKNPHDGQIQTFHSAFPNLRFAGITSLVGPGNSYGLNPGIMIFPAPGLLLSLIGRYFMRTHKSDGIHTAGGFPLALATNEDRFTGAGAALFLSKSWSYYTYTVLAEYFHPGQLIQDNTPGLDVYFFMTGITFKF